MRTLCHEHDFLGTYVWLSLQMFALCRLQAVVCSGVQLRALSVVSIQLPQSVVLTRSFATGETTLRLRRFGACVVAAMGDVGSPAPWAVGRLALRRAAAEASVDRRCPLSRLFILATLIWAVSVA